MYAIIYKKYKIFKIQIFYIFVIINFNIYILSSEAEDLTSLIKSFLPNKAQSNSEFLKSATLNDLFKLVHKLKSNAPQQALQFFYLANIRMKQDAICYLNSQYALQQLELTFSASKLLITLIDNLSKFYNLDFKKVKSRIIGEIYNAITLAQENDGNLPLPFTLQNQELKPSWKQERIKLLKVTEKHSNFVFLVVPEEIQNSDWKIFFELNESECVQCFEQYAKFKCQTCKSRRYCSKECQQVDWKHHKEICVAREKKSDT